MAQEQNKKSVARMKLALIGDAAVSHYTVAYRLWELVSVVTGLDFSYEVVAADKAQDVTAFYDQFRADPKFKGMNVAIPWKGELANKVDRIEPLSKLPYINTIYKDGDSIVGVNTDPLAAQKAAEARANLYKASSALVLGARGSGLPIAHHLYDTLGMEVYIHDNTVALDAVPDGLTHLPSLAELGKRRYDLIVNATPLGRYYFDTGTSIFCTPLDLDLMSDITHPDTIIQETNYLPASTLLLQMGKALGLQTVPGDLMLVYRAVESLKRFCDAGLDDNAISMLLEEMNLHIGDVEAALLSTDHRAGTSKAS